MLRERQDNGFELLLESVKPSDAQRDHKSKSSDPSDKQYLYCPGGKLVIFVSVSDSTSFAVPGQIQYIDLSDSMRNHSENGADASSRITMTVMGSPFFMNDCQSRSKQAFFNPVDVRETTDTQG